MNCSVMGICAEGKEKHAVLFHTLGSAGGIYLIQNNLALCLVLE